MDDFDASGFPMTGNITETTSEQCFNISIINDNRKEDNETFSVHLNAIASQGNFIYSPLYALVTIEDDDSK